MIKSGQIFIDKDNNRYLAYGLAEQEGTGECVVIIRCVNTGKYVVKQVHKFNEEYSLLENAI